MHVVATPSSSGSNELRAPGASDPSPSLADALDAIWRAISESAALEDCWLERIRRGLRATLAYLDQDANCARVLVLEGFVGGATAVACARRVQSALAPVLREAREEIIIGTQVRPSPGLIAELLTLGVLSIVRSRVLRSDGLALAELEPSLMVHVVEPYVGRGAERADRSARPGAVRGQRQARMEMVPIRPHPRTIQALRVIASAPRLSSREVGRAVGIENNSGHVSMLLHRLEQRGLIENASAPQTGRQPHTWFLTPYGARVLEVLASSFSAASVRERDHALPERAPRRSAPGSGVQARGRAAGSVA